MWRFLHPRETDSGVYDSFLVLLGVAPSTIYEWCRMGYLPHIRIGTGDKRPVLRFRWSAIEAWIREKEKQGRPIRLPEKALESEYT